MKKALLPVLLILLLPLAAQAQDQNDPCENAETTLEINDCMGEVFKQADAELNRVYKAAMAYISQEGAWHFGSARHLVSTSLCLNNRISP